MSDSVPDAPAEKRETDLRIHYGPIYGREFGDTMALCKPTGTLNAIMSTDLRMVDCKACRDLRLTIPPPPSTFKG